MSDMIDGITRYLLPSLILLNYGDFEALSDIMLDEMKKIALDGDIEVHSNHKKISFT
jgi:hypothetical protein